MVDSSWFSIGSDAPYKLAMTCIVMIKLYVYIYLYLLIYKYFCMYFVGNFRRTQESFTSPRFAIHERRHREPTGMQRNST